MTVADVSIRAALALANEGAPAKTAARIASTLDLPADATDSEISDAVTALRRDTPGLFGKPGGESKPSGSGSLKSGADRYRAKHPPKDAA